jgi:hypothetical protein
MRLDEVLTMGGFSQMTGPGTFIANQVVQPRTVQADEPEQQSGSPDYERAKERQPRLERIPVRSYNHRKEDQQKYYWDNDMNSEVIAKKFNEIMNALKKDPTIKMAKNYTHFARTRQLPYRP